MSPEDFVPVLALALWCGLRGAPFGRCALFTLPLAWLVGGLLGLSASTVNRSTLLSAAWFLLLGGLLALDARLSLRAVTARAALLGLYHGYINGAGLGQFTTATVALVGLSFAVFAIVALAAAVAVPLRAQWSRIAVRVTGSWIAASGLLLVAWVVRTA